jgi:pilus assembly protein Flp/PilA
MFVCTRGNACARLPFDSSILRGKEVIFMLLNKTEAGQGMTEYALILILVAVIVIVILALLGPAIGNIFSNIMPLI